MADGKWMLVNGKWQMNKNAKVEVSSANDGSQKSFVLFLQNYDSFYFYVRWK
jgi:hypothetical protein